jgi:hypothetical protein
MSASATNLRLKETSANELAWLLRSARIFLASERPRVCVDCGHLFTLPSLMSGRRCLRCGVVASDPPEIGDNPDIDSTPETEGPSPL